MKTLQDFYDYLLTKRNFSEITINNYKSALSKFFKVIKTQNSTKRMVENYITEMYKHKYSYSHIVNTSVTLENYMLFIGRKIGLGRPKKPKQIIKNTLTEGEIARMMAAAKNERERAVVGILAYAGIRNKELCSLKTEDVDLGNQYLRVISGKGNKDRITYISKECSKIVIEYIDKFIRTDTYLFTTLRENKKYNGWALRKMIKKIAERANIKKRVYPHLFRHSLACNLLNRGMNIMTIKEQLGHADIRTTLIYAHSTPQRVQQEYNFYCPSYN